LISSLPLQRWLSHLSPLQSPGNVETEGHENHSPDWWFLKNGKAGHLIDLAELKDITGSSPTDFGITHLKKNDEENDEHDTVSFDTEKKKSFETCWFSMVFARNETTNQHQVPAMASPLRCTVHPSSIHLRSTPRYL